MKTCSHCGGAVAEPGEVTGWAGKWCRCMWENGQLKRDPYRVPQVEIDKYMERQSKNLVQRPSYSHILNLCEQLKISELDALIILLKQMRDDRSMEAASK